MCAGAAAAAAAAARRLPLWGPTVCYCCVWRHTTHTGYMGKKRKKGGCYHCGSTSHRARNCPECICVRCGEKGHEPPACPLAPSSGPPREDMGSFGGPLDHQGPQGDDKGPRKPETSFTYIELFAGIGGFRVALDCLGGRCVFASEMDRFARSSYAENHCGENPAGDITCIPDTRIPAHDILTAGFPCQPFSFSGNRKGFGDARGTLFMEIVRIARARQPKALLLENVRGLVHHDGGRTLATIVHALEGCGYSIRHHVLDAVALLPQERARIFIVGIRRDLPAGLFSFPRLPQLKRTVHDILQPSPSARGSAVEGVGSLSATVLGVAEEEALCLSEHQLRKVREQPYTQRHPEARFLSGQVAARTIQSSYGSYMVGSQFVPCGGGAMPASACPGDGSRAQSERWRRFSSRECARLQGFPESWSLHAQRAYRLLGMDPN
jgi:DNA-cytosine methyltransferase